jgi:hypothetical protein
MRAPRVALMHKPDCVTRYVQRASEGPHVWEKQGYRNGIAIRLPLGRFLMVTRRAW